MKYFLGTDHAGIKVRDFIVEYFAKRGIELVDLSPRGVKREWIIQILQKRFALKSCKIPILEGSWCAEVELG